MRKKTAAIAENLENNTSTVFLVMFYVHDMLNDWYK